jgi:hypothetical protein
MIYLPSYMRIILTISRSLISLTNGIRRSINYYYMKYIRAQNTIQRGEVYVKYMNQDSTNPESIKCSIDDRSHVPITDYESGEVVCGNCGIVLITIDSFEVDDSQGQGRGQQHLAFTSFETPSSNSTIGTGASTSLLSRHDRGLATIIGRPNVDASGKKLESDMRSTFKRLRTWDARTQMSTSTNRNLEGLFRA